MHRLDREADSSRRGITRFIDPGWSLPVSRMPHGCCWNSWAMTWVSDGLSRRPFGVDTLNEVQIIKPAEDGPYSQTQTHGLMQNATPVMAWWKMLLLPLSPTNFVADFLNLKTSSYDTMKPWSWRSLINSELLCLCCSFTKPRIGWFLVCVMWPCKKSL